MNIKRNKDPKSIWNNLVKLLLIIMSGALIYSLPYFRLYYYDAFRQTFHITNTQLGLLGSAFGIAGVFSYFLGGLIADSFRPKTLMVFSLVTTGLGGLVLLTNPSYPVLFAVHMYWGVSSLLTFWPVIIKVLRTLGTESEQSKVFGFFEGGRGLTNAVFLALALVLFGVIIAKFGNVVGIKGVIITYSAIDILLGIIIFFIFKDEVTIRVESADVERKKFDMEMLKKILSMKHTWMIAVIIFCSYSMLISFYYFTPYASSQFGTTQVVAAAITILSQWVRPIGCVGAGFFGDKIGSSKVMAIGFLIMVGALSSVLIIPTELSMITIFIVTVIVIFIAMYAMQSMHYALLEEGGYSIAISGMTVGVIATIGYLPELVTPFIAGKLLDKFPGIWGYRYLFDYEITLAVIGFVTILLWLNSTKVRRAEIRVIAEKNKIISEVGFVN